MVTASSSIFLFIGKDDCLKEEALKSLIKSVLDGASAEFDYKTFYGDEATSGEILEYLQTPPFLAPKRFAVIKNFDGLTRDSKEALNSYAKNPSKKACLVIDSEDEGIVDECAAIARSAEIKRFNFLDDNKASQRIKASLASCGKKISNEALSILNELRLNDLSSLNHELDKLIAYSGDKANIGAKDVESLVGKPLFSSAFDLGWAIGKGDVKKSVRITRDLLLAGKRPHEIIGAVAWHIRRAGSAKIMKSKGMPDYSIARVLKIGKTYSENFFSSLGLFSIAKLKFQIELLLKTDLEIKNTRFEAALILETAIIRLCLGR